MVLVKLIGANVSIPETVTGTLAVWPWNVAVTTAEPLASGNTRPAASTRATFGSETA